MPLRFFAFAAVVYGFSGARHAAKLSGSAVPRICTRSSIMLALCTPQERQRPPLAIGRLSSSLAARLAEAGATDVHFSRPPYALSGLPRPKRRGSLVGFMHKSRAWYILTFAYLVAAALLSPKPLGTWDLIPRLGLVAASSASVAISDGYHNLDLRSDGRVDPMEELTWLRLDYISISAMLTTNLVLWSANMGWVCGLQQAGIAAAMATAAVVTAALIAVPRRAGHIFVKLTFAFQFAGLLGYLVFCALTSPMPICSAIYFCYLPGFILYATKWPKHDVFGYHEMFHFSVIIGHLASMGLDLYLLK